MENLVIFELIVMFITGEMDDKSCPQNYSLGANLLTCRVAAVDLHDSTATIYSVSTAQWQNLGSAHLLSLQPNLGFRQVLSRNRDSPVFSTLFHQRKHYNPQSVRNRSKFNLPSAAPSLTVCVANNHKLPPTRLATKSQSPANPSDLLPPIDPNTKKTPRTTQTQLWRAAEIAV